MKKERVAAETVARFAVVTGSQAHRCKELGVDLYTLTDRNGGNVQVTLNHHQDL